MNNSLIATEKSVLPNFDVRRYSTKIQSYTQVHISKDSKELGIMLMPASDLQVRDQDSILAEAKRLYTYFEWAKSILDLNKLKELESTKSLPNNLTNYVATIVACNMAYIYVSRAQTEEVSSSIRIESESDSDSDVIDAMVKHCVEKLEPVFLKVFTRLPEYIEDASIFIWRDVFTHAGLTMEEEIGAEAIRLMSGEEFETSFLHFVYEHESSVYRFMDALCIYGQDLARLALEAFSPATMPFAKLRRWVGVKAGTGRKVKFSSEEFLRLAPFAAKRIGANTPTLEITAIAKELKSSRKTIRETIARIEKDDPTFFKRLQALTSEAYMESLSKDTHI